MKKFLVLIAALALTLALTACTGSEELPELPETVDMTNIDEYMNREDVQYVDLRNFEDKMKSGYISGFEFIPFFHYLELEDILVRTDGDFTFDAADIVDETALKALFDEDKTIFLMCQSGGRAGFVKAALEEAGYTDVYNVGGFKDYTGDNKVEGDGTYSLAPAVAGMYTPGVYYGVEGAYRAVVVINENGGLEAVTFDAITCYDEDGDIDGVKEACYTKQELGFGYNMKLYGTDVELEWFEQADLVAAAVLANQGWSADWEMVVDGSHEKFVATDAEVIADGLVGATIGVEGFEGALEAALTAATPAS